MEMNSTEAIGPATVGVIIDDGDGHYFAIAWDDLRRFEVPPPWVATVEALVRGTEPVERDAELLVSMDTLALSGDYALLIEALSAMKGPRLAAQRLEAWALLR